MIAAARRGGANLPITARMNPAVTAAISSIEPDGWTVISYPNAVWDDEQQRWISDAEVAEVPFIALDVPPKGRCPLMWSGPVKVSRGGG